jgi:hypothetical protein
MVQLSLGSLLATRSNLIGYFSSRLIWLVSVIRNTNHLHQVHTSIHVLVTCALYAHCSHLMEANIIAEILRLTRTCSELWSDESRVTNPWWRKLTFDQVLTNNFASNHNTHYGYNRVLATITVLEESRYRHYLTPTPILSHLDSATHNYITCIRT